MSDVNKKVDVIISSLGSSSLQASGGQLLLITPPLPTEIFCGREGDLKRMKECFEFPKISVELKKQCKFVLYGVGGIGKTQLALKFIEENEDKYVIVI